MVLVMCKSHLKKCAKSCFSLFINNFPQVFIFYLFDPVICMTIKY
jgi:hypothetical protein